jgi:hypothetical protein
MCSYITLLSYCLFCNKLYIYANKLICRKENPIYNTALIGTKAFTCYSSCCLRSAGTNYVVVAADTCYHRTAACVIVTLSTAVPEGLACDWTWTFTLKCLRIITLVMGVPRWIYGAKLSIKSSIFLGCSSSAFLVWVHLGYGASSVHELCPAFPKQLDIPMGMRLALEN